jgi:regulator of sigma E protease
MLTIIVFLLILSILVLIHEAGHYFVAKKLGIKVEEFGFGFPPRVFGFRRGETLYSVNLLPIGGFVKLYGEDEAGAGRLTSKTKVPEKDLKRAYFARPIHQRAAVVVAGVLMNFILAVIIVTYLFSSQGIPTPTDSVAVTEVEKNSPAESAGIRKGDKVLKIQGKDIRSTHELIAETRSNLGEKISITLKRGEQEKTIQVTPRKNFSETQGPMGVAISQEIKVVKHPFPQSIYYGTKQALSDSALVVVGFKNVLIDIFTKFTVPEGVAGPIGMAQLTGEFVRVGSSAVLGLIYMLTLSLAVLNILPIPALDGGRFFFILIEAVTRRKINPKFEAYAHAAGIALLLIFLAVVSYKDVLRLISGQSILPQ